MPLLQLPSTGLFRFDALTGVMITLIALVVSVVLVYSQRYLAGDPLQRRHQIGVGLLGITVTLQVLSDHMLLVLVTWVIGNLLLINLMIHDWSWSAARHSGRIAGRTLAGGALALAAGIWLLAEETGTPSIHAMITSSSPGSGLSLTLIILAALTQSAVWPFHHWLLSSLNSPTPVSALMHAGVVNGGGLLLVRFAPLLIQHPWLMHLLFVLGFASAIIGTFWKLLQPDVKRMLACSTMAQMGFMLMQCGLGLFAPAISHLFGHGLFKAYQFLNAGSAVRTLPATNREEGTTVSSIFIALTSAVFASVCFSSVAGFPLLPADSRAWLPALGALAAARVSLSGTMGRSLLSNLLIAPVAGLFVGLLYGGSYRLMDEILHPLPLMSPQPWNVLSSMCLSLLLLLGLILMVVPYRRFASSPIWKWIYLRAWNASQPHPLTIMTHRTHATLTNNP